MSFSSSSIVSDPFDHWFAAVAERHLSDLTFQEVRRSVQALSQRYVERRGRALADALSTRGKRAAFALYYTPLHFLTVRAILRQAAVGPSPRRILDLGSGTGAAGAAWALEARPEATVTALDINDWAVRECRWNLRRFGIRGTVRRRDVADIGLDEESGDSGIVAAFTINELPDRTREAVLEKLADAAGRGARILIVEPISRRPSPWWNHWADTFALADGRSDEWRFRVDLPELVRRLDKAAGLDHKSLTARSIVAGPRPPR